jgi:hypothetical protein
VSKRCEVIANSRPMLSGEGIPSRGCPQARISPTMKKSAFPNKGGDKKPLDRREDPLARDSRGKANRADVRKVAKAPASRAPRSGGSRGSK